MRVRARAGPDVSGGQPQRISAPREGGSVTNLLEDGIRLPVGHKVGLGPGWGAGVREAGAHRARVTLRRSRNVEGSCKEGGRRRERKV